MKAGYTPHSPRAGFASESISDGVPFQQVKEWGRWLVDSSLRVYIDIAATAQLEADFRLRQLGPVLKLAQERLLDFFPDARPVMWEYDQLAADGPRADGREASAVGRGPVRAAAGGLPAAPPETTAQGSHAAAEDNSVGLRRRSARGAADRSGDLIGAPLGRRRPSSNKRRGPPKEAEHVDETARPWLVEVAQKDLDQMALGGLCAPLDLRR